VRATQVIRNRIFTLTHVSLLARLFVVYLFNSFTLERGCGLSLWLISMETVIISTMEEKTTISALYLWKSHKRQNTKRPYHIHIYIYINITSPVGSHTSGTFSDCLNNWMKIGSIRVCGLTFMESTRGKYSQTNLDNK